MRLIQKGFECKYELDIFMNMLFEKDDDVTVTTSLFSDPERINVSAEIIYKGKKYKESCSYPYYPTETKEKYEKRNYVCSVIKAFLKTASNIKEVSLPWGVLSGIRPAKTVTQYKNAGFSYDFIKENIMCGLYGTSIDKAGLAVTVSKNETEILKKVSCGSVSIYIGIPFCTSHCGYCSFVSSDMKTSGKYIKDFCRLLGEEIKKTARLLKERELYVQNIYIGGGTPTALDEESLSFVLDNVKRYFLNTKLTEFTVEAGRPDTVNKEKLKIIKAAGADRISINPQTLNDKTLERIGRKHTVEDFYSAFSLAREMGFNNINSDIIAGLPGEEPEDFFNTADGIVLLSPESVTVHSMCIKRAARFDKKELTDPQNAQKMLSYASEKLISNAYSPYYMYRQKNISGNLENVGYAKEDKASLYNVSIMEETQTVIALGGGGVSKAVNGDKIERIFNFKDPYEYISRFDEISERKDKLFELIKR